MASSLRQQQRASLKQSSGVRAVLQTRVPFSCYEGLGFRGLLEPEVGPTLENYSGFDGSGFQEVADS